MHHHLVKWGLLIISCFGLLSCQQQTIRPENSGRQHLQPTISEMSEAVEYDIEEMEEYQTDNVAETNLKLGVEYMKMGKYDIALTRLRKSLKHDPNYPDAHNALAVLYQQIGETERARTHYEKAVKLDKMNSDVQNNYGQFLCKHGEWEKATQAFLTAIANPIYRTPEYPYTNAGICALRFKKYDQAETYLRKALQANNRFSQALFNMARLHFQQGLYQDALGFLNRFTKTRRHTPKSLWLGIQIARALNDYQMESSYTRKLRSEYPDAFEVQQLNQTRYNFR